jgi:hypothetical protein
LCRSSAGDEVAVFSRWHKNNRSSTHGLLKSVAQGNMAEMMERDTGKCDCIRLARLPSNKA